MDNQILIIIIIIMAIVCSSSTSSVIGGYLYNQQQPLQPQPLSTQPQPSSTQPQPSSTQPQPSSIQQPQQSSSQKVELCKQMYGFDADSNRCTSYWDCNVGDLNVGTVGIWQGHTKDDATRACNDRNKECYGNCIAKYNKQKSAPTLIQADEMIKYAKTEEEEQDAKKHAQEQQEQCKIQ